MLQENEILQKAKELTRRIAEAESKTADYAARKDSEIPARIAELREQLKKIDEYSYKINTYRAIAEAHLESRNLPTIEAPPGYRVNLNRLRNWAMMIDPLSPNDPYAQRVYLTARCDELFLAQKKREFCERIAQLENGDVTLILAETEALKQQISDIQAESDELVNSAEMSDFAASVMAENGEYCHETIPDIYFDRVGNTGRVALGTYAVPLPFSEAQHPRLKQLFGKYYDSEAGTVLLPAEISTEKEFAVSVCCTPTRTKQLEAGLRNLMLNIILRYAVGENKVVLLDTVRYNATVLGGLKRLENTFALEPVPETPEQAAALSERILSGFSDMDEVLQSYTSVAEYNREAEAAKRLPRTTLILLGGPNAVESDEGGHIRRILTEYERYGISFISVRFQEGDDESDELPEYAAQNAVYIRMGQNETTIQMPGDEPLPFVWYTLTSELPEGFAENLRQTEETPEPPESECAQQEDTDGITDTGDTNTGGDEPSVSADENIGEASDADGLDQSDEPLNEE